MCFQAWLWKIIGFILNLVSSEVTALFAFHYKMSEVSRIKIEPFFRYTPLGLHQCHHILGQLQDISHQRDHPGLV